VVVNAPRERVWATITEPDLLLRWFPTVAAEVDLRPGGAMRFVWEESADAAVIDVLEPPSLFVFRWRPESAAGTERPYTTVTFALAEEASGTRVTVTEEGFTALPDQIHEQSYEGNATGWASELEELRTLLATS
jgi:uncharacterized protein YndB with AHSA1/START domain